MMNRAGPGGKDPTKVGVDSASPGYVACET